MFWDARCGAPAEILTSWTTGNPNSNCDHENTPTGLICEHAPVHRHNLLLLLGGIISYPETHIMRWTDATHGKAIR